MQEDHGLESCFRRSASQCDGVDTGGQAAAIAVVIAGIALGAQQAPAARAAACTISGTITGLGGPLPGVSITVRRDDTVQKAASTDIDGTFKLTLPDASYQLTAELTGFSTDSEGRHRQQRNAAKAFRETSGVRADRRPDDDADAQGRAAPQGGRPRRRRMGAASVAGRSDGVAGRPRRMKRRKPPPNAVSNR